MRIFQIIRSGCMYLVLLFVFGNAVAADIPDNCRAVVNENGTLWLMGPDYRLSFRLTHDINPKFVIAGLSPDGKRIAYVEDITAPHSPEISNENIVLIDTSGKLLAKIDLHAVDAIAGLSWVNDSLLRAAQHVNPNVSRFHFIEVSNGRKSLALLQQLPKSAGTGCTPSPSLNEVACNSDNVSDELRLLPGDRNLYSVPSSAYSLAGEPAWSPDGKRIAVIEKNGKGQRWLLLLSSTPGKDSVEVREPMPVAGPVSRIDFTSNTHIRVEGETQVFEQDIPASGKLPDKTPYKLSPALPKHLTHGDSYYPVYGWICH